MRCGAVWSALWPPLPLSAPSPFLARSYVVGILIPRDKVKRALYWDTAGEPGSSHPTCLALARKQSG